MLFPFFRVAKVNPYRTLVWPVLLRRLAFMQPFPPGFKLPLGKDWHVPNCSNHCTRVY